MWRIEELEMIEVGVWDFNLFLIKLHGKSKKLNRAGFSSYRSEI